MKVSHVLRVRVDKIRSIPGVFLPDFDIFPEFLLRPLVFQISKKFNLPGDLL
jgi:hypothetical protein